MRRQKHSDFYYKLNELTERLYLFTSGYDARVPVYEQGFRQKKLLEHQRLMARLQKQRRRQLRE